MTFLLLFTKEMSYCPFDLISVGIDST